MDTERIPLCVNVSSLTHYCEVKRDIVFEENCKECDKFKNVEDTLLRKIKNRFKRTK